MEFKERLLNEIKSAGLDNFSDRLLNRKLGIYSTFEKREVTKALDELVHDGVLVSVEKGNYTLKDKCDAVSGVLRGNRRGFAFLIRDDGKADLFIPHKGLHGAQSGDKVFVVPVKGTADEGKVVSVIERGKRQLVGEYTSDRAGHGFVIPDDESYFSDVFIPTAGRGGAKNKDKVVVNIYDWDSGKNPVGEITEILGRANTIKGDTLAIIRDHGFYENFSKEALYDAERINKPVDMKEIAKRTDYRDLLTITIDGADAKDFDDAITVERQGDGFVLYVHIADVAHYIKQDGILDTEALKRATSVYLPNMVLPMLPEAVSNGVCSLVENKDRLTLSCVMEIDKTGKFTGNKIVESVIRSNHRMTYDDVQKILDGDKKLIEKYADVYDMIVCARDLERILNAKRRNRGSINFISEEPKFTIKEGKVLDVAPYPYYESNLIIEEFMLLANETVAEFMYHTELPFVYRVHEAPNKEKVLEFKKFVSSFNYNFVVHPEHARVGVPETAGRHKRRGGRAHNQQSHASQYAKGEVHDGECGTLRACARILLSFHVADTPLSRPDHSPRHQKDACRTTVGRGDYENAYQVRKGGGNIVGKGNRRGMCRARRRRLLQNAVYGGQIRRSLRRYNQRRNGIRGVRSTSKHGGRVYLA